MLSMDEFIDATYTLLHAPKTGSPLMAELSITVSPVELQQEEWTPTRFIYQPQPPTGGWGSSKTLDKGPGPCATDIRNVREQMRRKTNPERLLFTLTGSKWTLAPHLVRLFPEHSIYVSAFGGTASEFVHKHPSQREVFNDLDGNIYSVFAVLRDDRSVMKLLRLLDNSHAFSTPLRGVLRQTSRQRYQPARASVLLS